MRLVSFFLPGSISSGSPLVVRRRSLRRVDAVAVAVMLVAISAAPSTAANGNGRVPMPGEDGAGRTPRPPVPNGEPRHDDPRPGGGGETKPVSPRSPEHSTGGAADPAKAASSLDSALAGLAEAPDAAAAAVARARVTALWHASGSDTASLLEARAEAAAKAGDIGLAMDLLDAAIVVAPRWPAAVHERAILHLLREETGPAITDLRTALALEPRYFPALSMLSAVMESLERKADALALLKRAMALDPHGEDYAERLKRLTLEVEGREL